MNKGPDAQLTLFADAALSPLPSRTPKRRMAEGALTPIESRIVRTSADIALEDPDPEHLTYQHTVLCQTSIPYRSLDARRWQRRNGRISLEIEAGTVLDMRQGEFIEVPLPYGALARLILLHLNREALRTQLAIIETDKNLTAYIRRLVGYAPNGREIARFKAQLTQLAASRIRLGMIHKDRAIQVNSQIVAAMDLWAPTNPDQCVMWPSTIKLGAEYFQSLMEHAVPLDERAIAALSHSAMALDIYAWLAQRLHRIPEERPQRISWILLYRQFGTSYKRMRAFRAFFCRQLNAVLAQYLTARVNANAADGLELRHSPPPVRRILSVPSTS